MNTWIFQANPAIWNVEDVVIKDKYKTSWAANQNRDLMAINDVVYLWISGPTAGIYAIAHITAIPEPRNNDETGNTEYFVELEIDRTFGGKYISREKIKNNEILSKLRIITAGQGSNFLLKPEEAEELKTLIGSEFTVKPDYQLIIGQSYSKEEIEKVFDTNFGARVKGITLRKYPDGKKYIILFSGQKHSYPDIIEGQKIIYYGEGLTGDQSLTAANREMINTISDGRPVYGFFQNDTNQYKYRGLLSITDYDYVKIDGRMLYEFYLEPLNVASENKVIEIDKQIEDTGDREVISIGKEEKRTLTSKVRSAEFSRKVKQAYGYKCAFCGKARKNDKGQPEVEAAHIYPKHLNGQDKLWNGLSLCRLHHWAFDGGLITINENFEILVRHSIIDDQEYHEISELNGKTIYLPENKISRPEKKAITKRNNDLQSSAEIIEENKNS